MSLRNEHFGSDLTKDNDDVARRAIDNLACNLFYGRSSASDTAVIVLPKGEGAEFAVLDTFGTQFSGYVDFEPNNVRIGKRVDGSILFGIADLRLNSKVFRSPESTEPIKIFHDSHVIFESAKVWDFDIAEDGSSFVIHEPLPGNASRLIIRDIDDGKEAHIDLGMDLTPTDEYELAHAMRYSQDYSEVVFAPTHSDADGNGVYWFYPVGEGRTKQITVEHVAGALLT